MGSLVCWVPRKENEEWRDFVALAGREPSEAWERRDSSRQYIYQTFFSFFFLFLSIFVCNDWEKNMRVFHQPAGIFISPRGRNQARCLVTITGSGIRKKKSGVPDQWEFDNLALTSGDLCFGLLRFSIFCATMTLDDGPLTQRPRPRGNSRLLHELNAILRKKAAR